MSLLSKLGAFVAISALAQPAFSSSCGSRGIDFSDEGSYFINQASSENFTAVTQFDGCSGGYANILLVEPETNDTYICSQIPTTPDDVPQLSTCPILKSEMESGHWLLLIQGNNADSDPFDYQRDIYLTVGPQVTATITNSITWDITSTPIETITSPTTVYITETIPNTQTITSPSGTAKRTKTITPKATTIWTTGLYTKTRRAYTEELTTVTKTATATCTVPPKPSIRDKVAVYTVQTISGEASPTGVQAVGKRDKRVDSSVARRVLGNAHRLRGMSASERIQERRLQERAPDSETITVTNPTPANFTVTHTAPASTTTEEVLVTETTATTLPPNTVYSGITMVTITAPTPTKTRSKHAYTTVYTTKTLHQTWTYTTTVTPTASVSACRSKGGHYKHKPRV
ncbi:uncharacterized protein K452DRAFT_315875 [Aplosporella prunicola CBS 121167]|uniref:Uncharacterized protein n=1 Tax=Aplosporella prunicola CBS 121167 TaxID=1176127 RepID=A0A6A6BR22_9PEZI|nr:uncharacterized protein K452DRAFT_315875 [Aplosporella prunicola CBS 121167]KAF2145684.1 hypothetical protein K452DRAFT_315875 [Aplosporella prunicola CBS 121167]